MPRSSNGWTANDRSVIASYSLPGGKVALRKGDVSVVLLWCAHRWHETVEPLRWPGNWGYAERLVRGSNSTISDHASGTALDLNAPAHPMGLPAHVTFSAPQIRAVRAILEYCEGAVGWGADYRSRPDGMHLFIQANAAKVRTVADRIRTPQSSSAVLALGARGPAVVALQRVLNAWYPRDLVPPLATDGVYGPSTEAAVRLCQRRAGLPVDGICGPATATLLKLS